MFQSQGSSSRWSDAFPQPWRRLLLYDQCLHGVADGGHRVHPQRGLQDPDLRRQLWHHLQPLRRLGHDCRHAMGWQSWLRQGLTEVSKNWLRRAWPQILFFKIEQIVVQAGRSAYHYGTEVVGYLKQAKNFDVLVVRYKNEKLLSGKIYHCDYLLRLYFIYKKADGVGDDLIKSVCSAMQWKIFSPQKRWTHGATEPASLGSADAGGLHCWQHLVIPTREKKLNVPKSMFWVCKPDNRASSNNPLFGIYVHSFVDFQYKSW